MVTRVERGVGGRVWVFGGACVLAHALDVFGGLAAREEPVGRFRVLVGHRCTTRADLPEQAWASRERSDAQW